MKKLLISLALITAPLITAPLLANASVTINIGDPGFYGQIQLGGMQPQLIYSSPVIIERGPVQYAPIYLHVPSGYERDWRRHCFEYHACNRPVYFVDRTWYRDEYAPRYRSEHSYHEDKHGRGHWDNGNHYGQEKHGDREKHGRHRGHDD